MKVYLYYDASHVHSYDENGIDVIELLPGTHDEVRAFKYFMKAGSVLKPELYADRSVVYLFDGGKGVGLLKDEEAVRKLDTVCFYAPDYDKMPYTIHAVTDMEFVMVTANMDSHDCDCAVDTRLHLPFFRTEEQCDRYDQDCKTPGTISRTVLYGEFDRLGRLTIGICEGGNCGGTVEKGHPEVHQTISSPWALGKMPIPMTAKAATGTLSRLARTITCTPAAAKRYIIYGSNSIPTKEANKREECYYELSLCIQHGCGDSV